MSALLIGSVGLLASAAVGTAFSRRYPWWRRTADYRRPRILMYHMIRTPVAGAQFNKLRVSPAAFERQLQWLVRDGWTFAFLSELTADGRGPSTPKTVVLTFDDGYRDNYLAAHPLLDKYDAKATLFLVADRFDRDWSKTKKAHHDSGELAAEPKLSNDDVRAMLASGRWELGAHTLTHAFLPRLTPVEREQEVAGGKTALETEFGVPVRSFAYPFGVFGDVDVAAARAAGYRFAATTESGVYMPGVDDPLRLKRLKVGGKQGLFGFRLRLRTG